MYLIEIKLIVVNHVNKPKNACYKLSVDKILTTRQLIIINSAGKGNTWRRRYQVEILYILYKVYI